MSATIGALIGAVGALGVLLLVSGLGSSVAPGASIGRAANGGSGGATAPPADPGRRWSPTSVGPRGLLGALASLGIGWAITGWPAMGVTLAAGSLVVHAAVEASRRRRRRDATAEALAAWAEMLADVIRSHAALGQAVRDTVDLAPDEIRVPVRRLAARIESTTVAEGLSAFAADIDHPGADAMAAALLIAADGHGGEVPAVLDRIAVRTRVRTELELRVAAGRARHYAEARTMSLMTLALVAGALIAGRSYLEPYDDPVGQLVLLAVGAFFVGAGAALIGLGEPNDEPRRVLVRTAVDR